MAGNGNLDIIEIFKHLLIVVLKFELFRKKNQFQFHLNEE